MRTLKLILNTPDRLGWLAIAFAVLTIALITAAFGHVATTAIEKAAHAAAQDRV